MDKTKLKKLSVEDLQKEVLSLKKELFNLKLQIKSGQIKDTSQFKKVKKTIAQSLTFLKEQSLGQ